MPLPLFAPTVLLGEPCPVSDRVPLAAIDHGQFDALLNKYVDDRGRVAYAEWKASETDARALHSYLAAVGRADLDSPAAHDARLAFWINTYNAVTIAGLLRVYPTPSIRSHTNRVFGFNIWKNLKLHIGGRSVSLTEIEHGVLRALNDPRVHFGLVCGSNGCPVLPRRAYTPDAVSAQLDAGARAFLARPDAVQIDPEKRTVSLSKLFKWYGTDLGPTPVEQLALLRRLLPAGAVLDQLDDSQVRVVYMPYDWSLNDQKAE